MTYVGQARGRLLAALGDTEQDWCDEQPLLDLYTLLVLVRGRACTLADIHDAWAVARQRTRPEHPDLVPFEQLTGEVQAYDEPYRDAVARAGDPLREWFAEPHTRGLSEAIAAAMDHVARERDAIALMPAPLNAALIAEHMIAAGWPASWPPGPVESLPAVTPYLVTHIGRRLQDIADAANALLGREPDPGSPWDGRPLGAELDPALRERIAAAIHRDCDGASYDRPVSDCGRCWRTADAVMGVLSAAPPERHNIETPQALLDALRAERDQLHQRDADKHDRLWGLVDMWRDKAAEARSEEKVAPQHDANEACGRARALDEAADALVETVSAAPPEREAPSPASVRTAALGRIEQREATPGNPADGPYPASVGEVADELAGLVVELDAGPAPRLVRELAARLPEREAPSREEAINVVWRGLSDDLRRARSGGVDVDMRPASIVDALIERGWLQVHEGEVRCDGE
jgi:hypothetical protein